MILLDTHAWIWWTDDPGRLSQDAARLIRSENAFGVSAVSCLEFAMLVAKNRIRSDRDPQTWMEEGLSRPGVELLPITPAVAVRATQLGRGFPGDPADRIIVATAMLHHATLVTKDDRIRDSRVVPTCW